MKDKDVIAHNLRSLRELIRAVYQESESDSTLEIEDNSDNGKKHANLLAVAPIGKIGVGNH